MPDVSSLITLGPLSLQLGVLEGHLRKLCNRGKVPHAKLRGMRVFDTADVPAIRAALVEAGYLKPAECAAAPR